MTMPNDLSKMLFQFVLAYIASAVAFKILRSSTFTHVTRFNSRALNDCVSWLLELCLIVGAFGGACYIVCYALPVHGYVFCKDVVIVASMRWCFEYGHVLQGKIENQLFGHTRYSKQLSTLITGMAFTGFMVLIVNFLPPRCLLHGKDAHPWQSRAQTRSSHSPVSMNRRTELPERSLPVMSSQSSQEVPRRGRGRPPKNRQMPLVSQSSTTTVEQEAVPPSKREETVVQMTQLAERSGTISRREVSTAFRIPVILEVEQVSLDGGRVDP